jgi:hypothetical protein
MSLAPPFSKALSIFEIQTFDGSPRTYTMLLSTSSSTLIATRAFVLPKDQPMRLVVEIADFSEEDRPAILDNLVSNMARANQLCWDSGGHPHHGHIISGIIEHTIHQLWSRACSRIAVYAVPEQIYADTLPKLSYLFETNMPSYLACHFASSFSRSYILGV